jgi:ABC-type multidrug transport system fused ATPase/permease subunit
MHLRELFKKYKAKISFAVFLVIIENVAWIIEPFLIGLVIDILIDKEYVDPTVNTFWPIFCWVGLYVLNSAAGTYRRVYDTKLFTSIFTKIATYVSQDSLEKNLTVSQTAARAELSYQYVAFLQYRMPEIIDQLVAIFGAIIAMYLFDWRISVTCAVIIFPLYFINRFYVKKVSVYQKEYHDKYEDVVDVISKKDPKHIEKYYEELAKPQIKISNWGALNFSLMRVVLLFIFMSVIYISIDLDEFSAGELFSIVAYLWTFVTASETLPELLESWTSLQDISKRLKKD